MILKHTDTQVAGNSQNHGIKNVLNKRMHLLAVFTSGNTGILSELTRPAVWLRVWLLASYRQLDKLMVTILYHNDYNHKDRRPTDEFSPTKYSLLVEDFVSWSNSEWLEWFLHCYKKELITIIKCTVSIENMLCRQHLFCFCHKIFNIFFVFIKYC